ncbi:MAG: FAD-dependent oxidoreductase [Shinella sp.]|nr:MAG: FAD-dependent oxidoreductase [Shinella sp.]
MATHFEFIVIGRGMMGAAAARHLTLEGKRVALIGPEEPVDRLAHQGVFSSHYDEARITRTFDDNPVWSQLASRSIERYDELESRSGIHFYTEAGCLFSTPLPGEEGYMARAVEVSKRLDLDVELIAFDDLAMRFPHMCFPDGHSGYFERRNAGHVNPRALVRAQALMAERQGAQLIAETAVSVLQSAAGVEVRTAEGGMYTAARVLVAAGGFTNLCGLLPQPVDMRATARTIVFFELDDKRQAEFSAMPSSVVFAERDEDLVYILPPVRYPDDKIYLKIGGDSEKTAFEDLPSIGGWFRSEGDAEEARKLERIAVSLMPGLEGAPTTSGACIASFTRTTYPYIGFTSLPDVAVLTGGNFVAAKCSDELGRLGARLIIDGALSESDFAEELRPVFL